MKLGVFTALFRDRSFEETCKYLSSLGVQTLELACGGSLLPWKPHPSQSGRDKNVS